jgi:hypothetical protein
MKLTVISICIAALLFVACAKEPAMVVRASDPPKPAATQSIPKLPPNHPDISTVANVTAPQPLAQPTTLNGKVLETMNAGGYTYLQIATTSGKVWAAVRETRVKKGATVTIAPQMVAENFESSSLHRKFDRLVMGVLVTDQAKPSAPPVTAANVMGTPAQHMSSAMADPGSVTVPKAEGGITVAEAWAKKAELKDKPIAIRGKVVKFLPDIMGKNWLHLRDGSGVRADGTDDITVTTSDVVKVGDVITIRGTLRLDKDFGAGYVYPIIVEDGKAEK